MRLPVPSSFLNALGVKPIPFFMVSSWIKAAAKCGFNARPLFQDAGIKVDLMHLNETRVSPLTMLSLLEQSVIMSKNKYFPLVLGDTFAFESLPEFETLLTTSATLRDALRVADMARHLVLQGQDSLAIDLVESNDTARINLRFGFPFTLLKSQGLPLHLVSDIVMTSIFKFGKNLQGSNQGVIGVEFESPSNPFADQIEAFFGVPVKYEQGNNALVFERRILDLPLEGAYAELNQQARMLAAERIGKEIRRQGVAAEIEEIIQQEPEMLAAGIEDMAERLNLHPRTLQRRLKDDQDGYLLIQARMRHRLACQWLRQADVSVDEISARLGFSDRRAFSSAFKRWEGISPKAWREANQP